MNKTNVGKSVFNKVGKMRLTAILLGLIVLMATALDIYADFVVTSTYAGTGNKTTASQMGISFSSTNEVVWPANAVYKYNNRPCQCSGIYVCIWNICY